jgi:hypothetical protein
VAVDEGPVDQADREEADLDRAIALSLALDPNQDAPPAPAPARGAPPVAEGEAKGEEAPPPPPRGPVAPPPDEGGAPVQWPYDVMGPATDGFAPQRELGRGSFGRVYAGRIAGRPVAIKVGGGISTTATEGGGGSPVSPRRCGRWRV